MHEDDPIRHDVRRAHRERRLGEGAACAFCGITTPEVLTRVNRSLLEHHHVVGRANDATLTVPLCLNCHRIVTEAMQQDGVPLDSPPTLLHRLVAILRALGAFFVTLGNQLVELAEQLLQFLQALEVRDPRWRQMPEAAT